MIRAFGLNDLWLVRQLQRSSVPMAIEHLLTHPHEPLWTALTAPWPWAGMGVATFVLDEQVPGDRLIGFVQLMKRAARAEADLLYLAPALAQEGPCDAETDAIWSRLLSHCSQAAASHGLQRIFASVPDGCREQVCLREAGFSLYTREMIYRLAVAPEGNVQPGFRPQGPQDGWALQRLYLHNTPRLVQQAEGAVSGRAGSPLFSWWEPDSWQGIVWEPAGEMRGAVQVHLGRAGHWMRVWGTNGLSVRELRSLVEQGLRLITNAVPRGKRRALPVYATVRDYEIGLGSVLAGFGFAPYTDRARFVKHTVLPVREAQPIDIAGIGSPAGSGGSQPVAIDPNTEVFSSNVCHNETSLMTWTPCCRCCRSLSSKRCGRPTKAITCSKSSWTWAGCPKRATWITS